MLDFEFFDTSINAERKKKKRDYSENHSGDHSSNNSDRYDNYDDSDRIVSSLLLNNAFLD